MFCLVELFENYDFVVKFRISCNFTTESHFFTALRETTNLFQEDKAQRIFLVRKGQLVLEKNVGKIGPTVWVKKEQVRTHRPHINQSIIVRFDKHSGILIIKYTFYARALN